MPKRIFVLFILSVLPMLSAPRWVRRATLVAACAASAADAVTTWRTGRAGMSEANPLLRGTDGGPAMGRVISLKVGFCGYAIWAEERKAHSTAFSVANTAVAATFGYVAWRNERLVRRVRGD
jgi:hypothetical protein